MTRSEKRRLWMVGAAQAWKKAPAHIRMMAGDYVGPLLTAIEAIGDELDEVQRQIAGGCCTGECEQGRNCPERSKQA